MPPCSIVASLEQRRGERSGGPAADAAPGPILVSPRSLRAAASMPRQAAIEFTPTEAASSTLTVLGLLWGLSRSRDSGTSRREGFSSRRNSHVLTIGHCDQIGNILSRAGLRGLLPCERSGRPRGRSRKCELGWGVQDSHLTSSAVEWRKGGVCPP
jgi:hypothetical protein